MTNTRRIPTISVTRREIYDLFVGFFYDNHLRDEELFNSIKDDIGDIICAFATPEGIAKLFESFTVILVPSYMDTIEAYTTAGTQFIIAVFGDDDKIFATINGNTLNW